MTKRDILTEVAVKLGVLDPGDTLQGRETGTLSNVFDRVLDNWNAERQAVYASLKLSFTLTIGLSPHTIGASGGTWTTTQRPVSIDAANLVINTVSPTVRVPLTMRDAQWYAGVSVPAIQTSVPTDLYYQPDWPLGKCFFYGVPDAAYGVELWTRMVLSALGLDDSFDMPPGYRSAIVLTCAEEAAEDMAKELSPRTEQLAAKARARIFGNNTAAPRIRTRDAGMPGRSRGASNFNYLSRSFE